MGIKVKRLLSLALLTVTVAGTAYAAYTHHIQEVMSAGEYIKLEDGELFEVYILDRYRAGIWIPVDPIAIFQNPDGDPNYPYLLEDGRSHDSVRVRRIE